MVKLWAAAYSQIFSVRCGARKAGVEDVCGTGKEIA